MKYALTRRRGLSLVDVLVVLLVITIMLAIAVPSIARLNDISNIDQSKSNLITQSVAHTMYAADYNGRQHTVWLDDLTTYGSSYSQAIQNWQWSVGDFSQQGWNSVAMHIAWAPNGSWYFVQPGIGTNNIRQPIGLGFDTTNPHFGAFRLMYSVSAFNQYLNGRFYDSVLYAPNDTAVMELVEPYFDLPYMPISSASGFYWSSYISSPAALFHPDVFRAPSQGGVQNPWNMAHGLATLPLNGAKYADLKTHVMEHHWLQNNPDDYCNPLFGNGPYDGCQPYMFNHGMDSAPVTLFYDGHVRMLPNYEVHVSDQHVLQKTNGVDGLWSRDTSFGNNGYYIQYALDNTKLSHHILTTNGILGRDTLGLLSATPPNTRRSRGISNPSN